MKVTVVLTGLTVVLSSLSGCNQKPVQLTCKDDPTGRPKVEQQAIADACALGGKNSPSSQEKW